MHLRPARLEELPALSDLCLRSKGLWGYDRDFLEACRAELTLEPAELLTTRVVVAEREGVPAGLYQLEVDGAAAELLKFFVEPAMTRRGIGQTLFAAAVADAKAAGAQELFIEADPDAAAFYQRMGARPAGSVASGSIPGRFLPRFELALN